MTSVVVANGPVEHEKISSADGRANDPTSGKVSSSVEGETKPVRRPQWDWVLMVRGVEVYLDQTAEM
jgi:hypothetical protein